ncbi:MAG TPA: hypothetical protein VMQ50_08540 [Casimicrobiaceae bacterium]|nr:hypothetical protein [Casimicrobiaceae bacterium]
MDSEVDADVDSRLDLDYVVPAAVGQRSFRRPRASVARGQLLDIGLVVASWPTPGRIA